MENKGKLIDIENIIKTKNPSLYKKLPGFVIGLLKKIICQDKINRLLTLYGHLSGVEFIDAVFKDLNVKIINHGLENIDLTQRYVFAANHPLGGIDGLAVISSVNRNFGKAKAVVNELLMNIDNLKEVFCGVNVYGHASQNNAEDIETLFSSKESVC
ncbi:MAG: glycerol acyltransferase, partial [Bacteroidales bacterium]|nr:glycerol acyltransferase [Bacteroidales bacterium]